MADATTARDAVRAACDRKHDLAVILEDALIALDGEVRAPSPESAEWLAYTRDRLTAALTASDALRSAITAAQHEVAKIARQELNRG